MGIGLHLFSQQIEQSILPESNIHIYRDIKVFIHDMFREPDKHRDFLKKYTDCAGKFTGEIFDIWKMTAAERYVLLTNTLNEIDDIALPNELSAYFNQVHAENFNLKMYFIISAILELLNGEENYNNYIKDVTLPEHARKEAAILKQKFLELKLLFNQADIHLVQTFYKDLLLYPVTSIFSFY
ncbi:MAG: hypothetical protein LBJ24_05670 [Treponema sp.]|nr:hypothetical protein [Treponema sp.]